MWGISRYKPMLMVKVYVANYALPSYKENLVLLNDIAKTICIKSEIKINCDLFNGINLLDDNKKEDGPYYIYVLKENSSYEYDTHISVMIPTRKYSLLKSMQNSKLIELKELDGSQLQNLKDGFIIR